MQNLGFAKGFSMAERIEKSRYSKNTNKNRIRLKVKENPKYSRRHELKIQQKRDRRFKILLSIFTLAIVSTLAYFTFSKYSIVQAKIYERNKLVSENISQELKRDRLRAKLDNSIDLNRIQRYALEELGLVYQEKGRE